jgi:hypothetical protein
MHAVHTIIQVLHTLSGLGREKLEGDAGPPGGLLLQELATDMHLDGFWEKNLPSAINTVEERFSAKNTLTNNDH